MKKIFYALSLSYMIFSADAANAEGKLGTADNPIVIDDDDTVQSVQLVQSVQPVRQSNGVWTSVKAWVKKPLVIVCSFVASFAVAYGVYKYWDKAEQDKMGNGVYGGYIPKGNPFKGGTLENATSKEEKSLSERKITPEDVQTCTNRAHTYCKNNCPESVINWRRRSCDFAVNEFNCGVIADWVYWCKGGQYKEEQQ